MGGLLLTVFIGREGCTTDRVHWEGGVLLTVFIGREGCTTYRVLGGVLHTVFIWGCTTDRVHWEGGGVYY